MIRKAKRRAKARPRKAKRARKKVEIVELPEEMDDPTENPEGWDPDDDVVEESEAEEVSIPEIKAMTYCPGFTGVSASVQKSIQLADNNDSLDGRIGVQQWKWFVRSETPGLWFWSVGNREYQISGHDGPQLRDALFSIRSAARQLDDAVLRYGEKPPKHLLGNLERMMRWERRLNQNILDISGNGPGSWIVREKTNKKGS